MERIYKYICIYLVALLFCACGGGSGAQGSTKVKKYKLEVVKEYPHDTTSYTQGLFFHDGKMYESTGQLGESTLRLVDLESGNALSRRDFPDNIFLEGSVIFNGNLYLLTWRNRIVYVCDPETLEQKSQIKYSREGWGLTTDGKNLIATDGSSGLFFLNDKAQLVKRVAVTLNGRPVQFLNELEYIDGKVWANVYTKNQIVIINPSTGVVEGTIDATGLLPKSLRTSRTDVLNGIAVKDGRVFLTGKYWPRLYEVKLVEVK